MKRIGLLLVVLTFGVWGCANDGGMSEGTKRGAATGAIVGLTMGALTGDGSYALAGAAAGAVAGGAAGSWAVYTEDRQDYRAETLAAAIASKDTGGQGEAPAGWNDIDALVGRWQVTMWGQDSDGNRIDGEASAKSSLNSTQSVTFQFENFKAGAYSYSDLGSSTLSFAPDRGFELVNQFVTDPQGNRYVGHFDNNANRYKFYFAGSNQSTFSGIKRADYRLEMQMIGRDVILFETWAAVGSEEKRIQSYRLTRT